MRLCLTGLEALTVTHPAHLMLAFFGVLVLVGAFGEISGLRAVLCAKCADDFRRRSVFLVGVYWTISVLLSFLLVRLLVL